MQPLEILKQLNIVLPQPIDPLGSYSTVAQVGDQIFVSGLGPFEDGRPLTGIIGQDLTLEDGIRAARLTILMILSCIQRSYGLDNIERCTRLTVYIRAIDSFTQHPIIANGASDLILDIFGHLKLPARSALGVHTLPMGIPVEIDSVFQINNNVA